MKIFRRSRRTRTSILPQLLGIIFVCTLLGGGAGWYHFVLAAPESTPALILPLDPNLGVRPFAEEFLRANNAEALLQIIECESHFKHFSDDGTILKNRAGSSAIGIAQIMSSLHPDPKLIARYNRKMNTTLTPEDLDITTLKGNLGYAIILYELRGTRDWECAKYL